MTNCWRPTRSRPVHIVAKSREPVVSDQKVAIVPSATFDECPKDLDIICVPGGTGGTLATMMDADTIAFLKDRGVRAKLVTSVCTGSLLLGAAGLLKGYRATSHWLTRESLGDFGAEPVDRRVVVDRNRITGAGVRAGLDFGLSIAKQLRDERPVIGPVHSWNGHSRQTRCHTSSIRLPVAVRKPGQAANGVAYERTEIAAHDAPERLASSMNAS